MYFVLFCLQVYEYESITKGLKGGGRGIISVGGLCVAVYGILTMSAAISSSS